MFIFYMYSISAALVDSDAKMCILVFTFTHTYYIEIFESYSLTCILYGCFRLSLCTYVFLILYCADPYPPYPSSDAVILLNIDVQVSNQARLVNIWHYQSGAGREVVLITLSLVSDATPGVLDYIIHFVKPLKLKLNSSLLLVLAKLLPHRSYGGGVNYSDENFLRG